MMIFKVIRKCIAYVIYFLLTLLFFILVLPRFFGFTPITIISGSMMPKYDIGSVIFYKQVSPKKLEVGDVITYKLDDINVTHRINRIEDNGFITKGDNNKTTDIGIVRKDQVLGKVSKFHLPTVGKYILSFYRNQILIVCISLFLIFDFFMDKKDKKD